MSLEELIKHVPPDAVYRRVPLPDDQNALGPWREAVKRYVPPGDDDKLWGELIYGAGEAGPPVPFPTGADGDRIRALLEQNQPALDLLDEGIRRGRLQLPEVYGDEIFDTVDGQDVRGVLRCVVRLSQMLWGRAKSFAAYGDADNESRTLIQMLRIGEMICNGSGVIVHYLMGDCERQSALKRIVALAKHTDTPSLVLRNLLSAIEQSLASSDGFAQSLRADFCCWSLYKLDQMAEGGDIEAFVDRLLKLYYIDGYIPITESSEPKWVIPTEGRLTWRREQIISLLRGHPCPFDKLATAQLLGQRVAAYIRSMDYLQRPPLWQFSRAASYWRFRWQWRRCWHRPRSTKRWPMQLAPCFPVDGLGHSDEARKEAADYRGLKRFGPIEPPTEADIAICRNKLRRVQNPVGWMLADELTSSDYRWVACNHLSALHEAKSLLEKRLTSSSRST